MTPRRNPTNTFYKIDFKKGTIKRTNKFCPRCKGSFMAQHKDRTACGRCGYSEYS